MALDPNDPSYTYNLYQQYLNNPLVNPISPNQQGIANPYITNISNFDGGNTTGVASNPSATGASLSDIGTSISNAISGITSISPASMVNSVVGMIGNAITNTSIPGIMATIANMMGIGQEAEAEDTGVDAPEVLDLLEK